MKYITEGVIRSLKRDEIEYDLKKNLIGKLMIIKEVELKISKIKYDKFGLVFGFYKKEEELFIKNIKKIEIDHKENTASIFLSSKRYTILL